MKTGLKSFSKNTIIYSIGTIALRFTAFLLIPLYTHYLSKSEFGLLQTLLFSIQVIITINDLGLRSAIIRFFSEYSDKNKLNYLLGSSIIIIVINSLFILFIFSIIPDSFIASLFKIEIIPNLIILTATAGIFQTLSLNILSYFRAVENSKLYMLISILTSIVLIVLTYILLSVFEFGIIGVFIAQTFSFGLMWLFTLIWIFTKHGLKVEKAILFKLIKFGFPLIFAMSGDLIINTYGSYQLGAHSGLEEVAIFSLAYKIAIITVMVLIGPFQMAYEPYVFKNKGNPKLKNTISRISVYILFVFCVISIFILITFRDLIYLVGGKEYTDAYLVIFLLLPGIGSTLFNYIGQSLLHINNKTRLTGTIIFLTTIFCLVITYISISFYGLFGLVFSINFYLIASSLLIFYYGTKEFPIKVDLKRFTIILSITLFAFIFIYLISDLSTFLYYFLSLVLILILFSWASFGNFFSKEEKESIKIFIKDLKARFI